ncbi:helix-turn-helix domain-containing protein [Desulfobotulus sp.]|uniref:helix-turn-helix domain-containing protein n=1 Tax=Desulfobotulus sp. TaxID=1940337 RepID=UPI002A36DD08|nr:helix-turn-helix domain-containing protein [Desulfobotulus sp.]MDY0164322.1 helix-turn-helix domain-containing protein [Desulfobotulus sp.]
MSEKATIHDLIDQRIRTLGITPKVLAAHMGVTEASISRWRRGVAEPHPQYWPELFAVLKISPDEVLPPASGRFIPNALIHPVRLPSEESQKSGLPSRSTQTEQSMVDIYESRLQDMRDALDRAERSRDRVENRLDELQADNRDLRKQIVEMSAENSKKIEALTSENLSLTKKIAELQMEILTLKTELSHPITPGRAAGES